MSGRCVRAFVHQQIVWAKDRGILTRSYYLWQHEPCFFGWLKGHKPPRVSDDYPSTVWTLPTVKVGEKTEHPTSKPVEMCSIGAVVGQTLHDLAPHKSRASEHGDTVVGHVRFPADLKG